MYHFHGLALVALALASSVSADSHGSGVAKTTYSCNDPATALAFNLKYFPLVDDGTLCDDDNYGSDGCTCDIDGVSYVYEAGRAETLEDQEGFGMHLINCSMNPQTGGMTTEEVDAIFTEKLSGMSSYDSFMDYNVAMLLDDLDSVVTSFDDDGIDYLSTYWTDQSIDYYGVIVQSPGSQMVIEAMAENSTVLEQRRKEGKLLRLEQRASTSAMQRAKARLAEMREKRKGKRGSTTADMTVISIGRAASDLDAVSTFYEDGMECTKTLDLDEDDVQKVCYLWSQVSSSTADICYTKRPDSMTSTDFTVLDFETMLKASHNATVSAGECNNKWSDHHYAVDSTSTFETNIGDYITENDVFYYCMDGQLHYIVDPTGWGIQFDVMQISFSGCSMSNAPPPPGMDDDDSSGVDCLCTAMTSCGGSTA